VNGIENEDFNFVVNPDEDDETPVPEPPHRREQEWERLARLPVNRGNIGRPREFLGHRDVDLQHDWSTDLAEEHLTADPETFISVQKRTDAGFVGGGHVPPDALNDGQRLVFNHIVEHFTQRISNISGERPQITNVLVMGTAGVGKSFLIRATESEIWRIARTRFGDDAYPNVRTAVKLVAFTGKAAFQVGGVTIHSLLSIKDKKMLDPLPVEQLRNLQSELKNMHFLFIDEMSMVGLKMLYMIDRRLREVFPADREKPFGGVTIVMFGNFAQLPPVMDAPLFHRPGERNPDMVHEGAKLYRETFTCVFHLQQQMRQQGHTENDIKFANLLAHLRSGQVNEEEWRIMQSHVLAQLPTEEARVFNDDALALFPTNDQVRERNLSTMESLQRPVVRILAKYVDTDEREGSTVSEQYAGGMQHELFLCVGARVCRTYRMRLMKGHADEKCVAEEGSLQWGPGNRQSDNVS